jgi:hypothetical protein
MKKIIELALVSLLLGLIIYLAFYYGRDEAKVYQCSLAEISPDYPPDVKAMCRKLARIYD